MDSSLGIESNPERLGAPLESQVPSLTAELEAFVAGTGELPMFSSQADYVIASGQLSRHRDRRAELSDGEISNITLAQLACDQFPAAQDELAKRRKRGTRLNVINELVGIYESNDDFADKVMLTWQIFMATDTAIIRTEDQLEKAEREYAKLLTSDAQSLLARSRREMTKRTIDAYKNGETRIDMDAVIFELRKPPQRKKYPWTSEQQEEKPEAAAAKPKPEKTPKPKPRTKTPPEPKHDLVVDESKAPEPKPPKPEKPPTPKGRRYMAQLAIEGAYTEDDPLVFVEDISEFNQFTAEFARAMKRQPNQLTTQFERFVVINGVARELVPRQRRCLNMLFKSYGAEPFLLEDGAYKHGFYLGGGTDYMRNRKLEELEQSLLEFVTWGLVAKMPSERGPRYLLLPVQLDQQMR